MTVSINEEECGAAGLDPKKVRAIAKRLDRAAADAHRLGLIVFGGGAGDGALYKPDFRKRPLVVATMEGGSWSGGDGAQAPDAAGLMRAE